MNVSYKGKLLISAPDLSGDIFSRSVILIIEHNEDGAFGLILNKKNEQLSHSIKLILGINTDIYEGGPVDNGRTRGQPKIEDFLPIDENFYLTENIEAITTEVLNDELNMDQVKVFSGYSGWTAMQLEGEVNRKIWTVVDVFNLDFTQPNDQKLWKTIMQNLGGDYLLWANAPQDVTMN